MGLLVVGNADAAILDGYAQQDVSGGGGMGRGHGNGDVALGRKLDGVADQVYQDLPQATRIAYQSAGCRRCNIQVKQKFFFFGTIGHAGDQVFHFVVQIERNAFQCHAAGFDFRIVQNVVDKCQQSIAAKAYGFCQLPLFGIQVGIEQ